MEAARSSRLKTSNECPGGVAIYSVDSKIKYFLSRNEAFESGMLKRTIEEDAKSKENTEGWSQEKFLTEPFITIDIPIDLPDTEVKFIYNYLKYISHSKNEEFQIAEKDEKALKKH